MPGAAKPTNLLLLEGKGHRTKAEMEYRERGEKALKTDITFFEQPQVKADKIAHREFLRLRRLYAKIELVEALDEQCINRYCQEISETANLRSHIAQLDADLESEDDVDRRLKLYEMRGKACVALSKNKEYLIKLEDRLFLNPVARIRAVPKTPPKEEKPTGMAAFLANRE